MLSINKQRIAFFKKHYDLGTYQNAYHKICESEGEVIFFLDQVTGYGGVLFAYIDGETTPTRVSKKKIRHSDFIALKKARY